jgi:hypothetical protein
MSRQGIAGCRDRNSSLSEFAASPIISRRRSTASCLTRSLSHASRPSPITSAISSAASRMSATRWSSRRLTGRQTPPGWRGRGFSGHRPRRRQRSGRAAPPTLATSASGRTGSCLDRSRPAGRCRCLARPHRALPSRKADPPRVMAGRDLHHLLVPGLNKHAQWPRRLVSQLPHLTDDWSLSGSG